MVRPGGTGRPGLQRPLRRCCIRRPTAVASGSTAVSGRSLAAHRARHTGTAPGSQGVAEPNGRRGSHSRTVPGGRSRVRAFRRALAGSLRPSTAAPLLVGKYGGKRALALAVEARKQGVARTRAVQFARQRQEAARRLAAAPPMPHKVKDPKSRKGIRMPRRRKPPRR